MNVRGSVLVLLVGAAPGTALLRQAFTGAL